VAALFALDANRTAGSRGQDRLRGAANGNLRLLVGTDDEFVGRKHTAISAAVMSATIPASSTWRRSSERLNRDSDSPSLAGSSHARAFTSAMTRGGKSRRPASPRTILESVEAFKEEALSPFAHHGSSQVETFPNLLVFESLGGKKHDPGAHDV